jgi:hypothetical protein
MHLLLAKERGIRYFGDSSHFYYKRYDNGILGDDAELIDATGAEDEPSDEDTLVKPQITYFRFGEWIPEIRSYIKADEMHQASTWIVKALMHELNYLRQQTKVLLPNLEPLAVLYFQQPEYQQTFEQITQSVLPFEDCDLIEQRFQCIYNVARIAGILGDMTRQKIMLEKLLSWGETRQLTIDMMALAKRSLAYVLADLGDVPAAITKLDEVSELQIKHYGSQDHIEVARTLGDLAVLRGGGDEKIVLEWVVSVLKLSPETTELEEAYAMAHISGHVPRTDTKVHSQTTLDPNTVALILSVVQVLIPTDLRKIEVIQARLRKTFPDVMLFNLPANVFRERFLKFLPLVLPVIPMDTLMQVLMTHCFSI